jgi:membrane fusion protein
LRPTRYRAVSHNWAFRPYQKFGRHTGKVIRVSRSAITTSKGDETQNTEPFYRVLVALDRQSITAYGKPEPLRPGMVLDAEIMSESRKLYEWILEPLCSVSGKVWN